MDPQLRNILIWALIGLVAGWLASLVVGGSGGLIGYLVAGLIGSVVGGFIARQFDIRLRFGNPFIEQLVIAFGGAVIVLIIARIVL